MLRNADFHTRITLNRCQHLLQANQLYMDTCTFLVIILQMLTEHFNIGIQSGNNCGTNIKVIDDL